MTLMFFISGLFVWGSLQQKGAERFLRDRLLRLGVPFVAAEDNQILIKPIEVLVAFDQELFYDRILIVH